MDVLRGRRKMNGVKRDMFMKGQGHDGEQITMIGSEHTAPIQTNTTRTGE